MRTMETYLVRINLINNKSEIDNHFNNNFVSINIRDYETADQGYFNDSINGKPYYKGAKFIKDFFSLCEAIEIDDVLIFATYPGKIESKLGKILKGTKYFTKRVDEEKITFYGFELTEVETLEDSKNTILLSALPPFSTISHIVKDRERFICKYTKKELPIELKYLTPKLTELICLEWLRSRLCPEDWKIKYQLLLIGGNNAKIDIYGKTFTDKIIACQVTTTENKKLIEDKGERLKEVGADIRIMFCNGEERKIKEVEVVLLQKVWDDLLNSEYRTFLETILRQ